MKEKLQQQLRREARIYVEEVFDELGLQYTEFQVNQAVDYLASVGEYLKVGHNLALARVEQEDA